MKRLKKIYCKERSLVKPHNIMKSRREMKIHSKIISRDIWAQKDKIDQYK